MSVKQELAIIRNKVALREEQSTTVGSHFFYKLLRNIIRGPKPSLPAPKKETKTLAPIEVKKESLILDDKVDEFVSWYQKNLVNGHYTDIGEYQIPIEMRNFIEKMASWYELRYPDYEVNRLMPGSGQENKDVNEEMFKNNPYVQDLVGKGTDIECFDWCDFYNFDAFYNSLPADEQRYFYDVHYSKIVYYSHYAHLHLDKDGYVYEADGVPFLDDIVDASNRIHIKDVWEYMCAKKIAVPEKCEIEKEILYHDNRLKQRNDMLDAVMFRLIERGGGRLGPRRAFLFAKEFSRDISIPMMYGVDTSDPGLRRFMNEYIKAGGSPDITCIINYCSRASKYEPMRKVSMRQLLRTTSDNCFNKYTEEEKELQQKLTNIFAYQAALKAQENNSSKKLGIVKSKKGR